MKRETYPQGWAKKLLQWLHPADTLEEVKGDLAELYTYWYSQEGKRKADLRYVLAVISVLPPFVRRRKPKHSYSNTSFLEPFMIRNYLTIAFRNLIKHKAYSCINILGLALGLACSLLILLWVQDELSMNQFHTNAERIFLVIDNRYEVDKGMSTSLGTPSLLAENLKKDFPEVEKAAVLTFEETVLLTAGSISGKEKGRYTNEDFLTIFSFPLLLGDARRALNRPDAIVLSRKLAQKYFPNQNPLGKLIRIDNQDVLIVTAVLDDLPANSSLTFDYLLHWERFLTYHEWAKGWDNSAFQTYTLLTEQADPDKLNANIKEYIKLKTNHAPWAANTTLSLQKNSDAYLYSTFTNGVPAGGRIEYVRLFVLVAFFILLIACFNFMNLATARAVKRAKEVGVRKVVGATQKTLITQFVSESLLIAFLSLLLALVLVGLLLPPFRQVTGKPLPFPLGIHELIIAIGLKGRIIPTLSPLISCLGLFGLTTFLAEAKTKEMSIRKVLGASVGNITLLLSKDFFKLILLAFVTALPISWYMMHQWLENFAYRVTIGIEVFLIAGMITLLIAFFTVSFRAIKAALMNPVKSLRSE